MIGIPIPPENEAAQNNNKPPVAIAYPVMRVVYQDVDEESQYIHPYPRDSVIHYRRPSEQRRPNEELPIYRLCRFFVVGAMFFSFMGAMMYLFLKPYF